MNPQPFSNPYISPHAMQAIHGNWASPDMVVGSGNMDIDMLSQAVQYEAASFPPGFGGMAHMTAANEALMQRARAFHRGENLPSQGSNSQGGGAGSNSGLTPSEGGERSTGRRVLGAGATAVVTGLGAYALLNCWNPTGWAAGTVALGVAGVGALVGFFM